MSGVAISLTKRFLPAQREEVGLGTEQPCPRRGQTSENSQEVPLLVLCELCPQLRAQAEGQEDPACRPLSGPQLVVQSCLTLCDPTEAYQAPLSMEFSRQEHWSGLHALLQRIFLTQGLNPGLLHCRQILYCLNHQGSPRPHVGQMME